MTGAGYGADASIANEDELQMSMNGYFRTASDATIERLKADPDKVPVFLGLDEEDEFASFGGGAAPFLRLVRGEGDAADEADEAPPQFTATATEQPAAGEGETLDIEKSWHGLHFLLTGSVGGGPTPLGYIMEGGVEVGEDLGYGPARALSSAEVRSFSAALGRISDAELRRRFDPQELERNQVYPNTWDEGDEAFEWLSEYFGELKSFIGRAAQNVMGMIAYLM